MALIRYFQAFSRIRPIPAPAREHPSSASATRASRRSQLLPWCCLLLGAAFATGGCASSGGVGETIGKTLAKVGIKAPAAADAASLEREIPLRLYAGGNLNAASDQRPMALVVKVYQLRDPGRFEQLPFDTFLDEEKERAALGNDLVEASEILLLPDKRHEGVEKLPGEAGYLGVVAQFRSPAASRWRFTFDAGKAMADGITVGLHACAMTTTSEALLTQLGTESYSLSSSNCKPPKRR